MAGRHNATGVLVMMIPVAHLGDTPFMAPMVFSAPLTCSMIATRGGSVTPTYSQGSGSSGAATGGGYVSDSENILRATKFNELRFTGARRVSNLLFYSENLSAGNWTKDNGGS